MTHIDDTTYHFGKWKPGTIVAVLEKEGDKVVDLGEILKSRGRNNRLHVYATNGKKNRKRLPKERISREAKFVKAFIDTNDHRMVLGEAHARRYPTKPYEWTISHDHKQTVAINLKLTAAGKLTKDSAARALQPGYKFHVS